MEKQELLKALGTALEAGDIIEIARLSAKLQKLPDIRESLKAAKAKATDEAKARASAQTKAQAELEIALMKTLEKFVPRLASAGATGFTATLEDGQLIVAVKGQRAKGTGNGGTHVMSGAPKLPALIALYGDRACGLAPELTETWRQRLARYETIDKAIGNGTHNGQRYSHVTLPLQTLHAKLLAEAQVDLLGLTDKDKTGA